MQRDAAVTNCYDVDMNIASRSSLFCQNIWDWFSRHKRTLPWRDVDIADDTQRAYMILVSEVMLQQTQVSRVETIFKRFLREFPTIKDLAKASNKDVIIAWRGMGYNSRALRLRDAAKTIVDQHKGVFPKEYDQLIAIKGIGPYTAAAVRNFAFNLPTPCIDTNIRRILHRVFIGPENEEGEFETKDKELLKLADEVLNVALKQPNAGTTADWHAALMDFGSAVCTKSNQNWDIFHIAKRGARKSSLTMKSKKKKIAKQEPGRLVGSVFIPNRIFRGRIVEALRDAHKGMTLDQIGAVITLDWADEHQSWLASLLSVLERDGMIKKMGKLYKLHE